MIPRRGVFSAAALGALAGALVPRVADASVPNEQDAPDLSRVERAIREAIRDVVDELRLQRTGCAPGLCGEVDAVRAQQRAFLKLNQRFPAFIEIGLDVWDRLWDWHVRNQQQLTITTLPEGRLGMTFMLTTLVLRPDFVSNFIGLGSDRL